MSKTCTKCGETKPLDDFHRDKGRVDGRNPHCKECVREYARRYREENREKERERNRRYREENRDKERERLRRYCEENRDNRLESARRYREENRDELLGYARRYHKENRDIINQGQKIRQAQNTRISNLLTSKKGVPYSPEEDALILCDNGMTAYQKAIEMGRTYGSVKARKHHLRRRPGRTEQSAQKKTPLHEQRGQKEFRKGLDMNDTALPTWEELSARQDAAMRRVMVYGMSGEVELKEEAMAEFKTVTDQMKAGQYK